MAVLRIEKYRQKNGDDVLKVILKPTKVFPERYFYCDISDEELVKKYIWRLHSQKNPYIVAGFGGLYSRQTLLFHQEKIHNKSRYYLDYINHVNGIEFDNVNRNLDEVTNQQNQWCKPSKGYAIDGQSFQPRIRVKSQDILAKCVRTEVEAIQSTYQLELQHENYRYEFLKDRRKDADILDMERTGQISEEEAIYHHVLRYADNAWYYYRYSLAEYFRDNHIPVPAFSLDSQGYMVSPITGVRLCPL